MKSPKIWIEIEGGNIMHIASTEHIDIVIRDLDLRDENGVPAESQRDPDSLVDEDGNVEFDLFGLLEELPEELQAICKEFSLESELTYEQCSQFLNLIEAHGYTFDYGLEAEPFDLRKIKNSVF